MEISRELQNAWNNTIGTFYVYVNLERIIEWITENMRPEEVFTKNDLRIWAEDGNLAGFSAPEKVFHKRELEAWALANGYAVKED